MICYGQFESINKQTAVGRYLLFVIFKKPISIPAIHGCNIFNEITVSTRPLMPVGYDFTLP
jgi:hypothetical protein